ncbi:hypothetical protein C1645_815679 [Glomus cerebriforme]|uniref:Uncharacterized protein n=1 Tax=Glomus cerebriforme TaxID=658196 RepID=A0A397TH42_9GLOM|nr:hypothetical protein C1645_815679 [Glomus cerebriforme]
MQSKLDSLKQCVVELLAENAEIKAENAKVKAENAKQERVVIDVATQPSTSKSKLLEDRKTDEFLDSVSKKKVSDMIR